MEHEHAINFSPLLLPTLLFITLFVLKISKISKIKLLAFITLVVFLYAHVNPNRLIASTHHNLESKTQEHPCCIPQINSVETTKVNSPKIVYFETFQTYFRTFRPYILSYTLNNKSPPLR